MRVKRRFCFLHDMDALVAQDAQAVAASASDRSKPAGDLIERQTKWDEVRDASGEVYYYNKETGERTWDREPRDQAYFNFERSEYSASKGEEIADAPPEKTRKHPNSIS